MLGLCLNRSYLTGLLMLVGLIGLAGCGKKPGAGLVCPPPGETCYDETGACFLPDGTPCEDADGDDPITDEDIDPSDGGDGTDDDGDVINSLPSCDCTISATDTDGDCIPNATESAASYTNPAVKDSDGDGINDGCEDRNLNGQRDAGESNANDNDSDNDCILDGLEDRDHDGRFELLFGETSPNLVDSDRDNVPDGGPSGEDKDCDGNVDPFVDTNSNGCWEPGEGQGETNAALADTDGDGIGDGREDFDQNGVCDSDENSCAFVADTDCDQLPDGSEDKNRNGQLNSGETNPRNNDSDNDGILDGTEDANHNGIVESETETDPRSVDSDGDTIPDGTEDADHDGVVDPPPTGADGCWTGVTPGETNPRRVDSDGDQISDDDEDKNKNAQCDSGTIADPNAPGGTREGLVESCAFLADTDCDGLSDSAEDKNRDGTYQLAETDARFNDTDRDGLIDGCPIGFNFTQCEDLTNDGRVDPGETDPRSVDTDLDGLDDRCEVQFDPSGCTSPSCITNATVEDTDGDGKLDGEEDANHNCRFEPPTETDPRVNNPPPAPGTPEYPRSQVCDAQNLKQLTFAEASDTAVDYRVAFEVEKFNGVSAEYTTRAFGIELAGANNAIVEDDPNDMVWGHLFESPTGVVVESGGTTAVNRNVYGFTYVTQDVNPLDDTLDDLRDRLAALYGASVVTEVSNVPARPAHDDLPNFSVVRAARQYRITVGASSAAAKSAVFVRQDLLARAFLPVDELANIRPTTILGDTTTDPVYGQVNCPGNPQCYQRFTMYIAAVQRRDQIIINNQPPTPDVTGVTLYVVALTPDDSTVDSNATVTRLYNERLTRLEDLTGGSAVARFEARRSSICEDRNAKQAKADLLFVVDDSASMQAVIDKLQQASRDAQAVLTANSTNVDYRVAMTTTNPSLYGRTVCENNVQGTAPSGTFVNTIGCMKLCPANCTDGCVGGSCPGTCGTVCDTSISDLLAAEQAAPGGDGTFQYRLPGGGGTFYYEDTAWLDCDGTTLGPNHCADADFDVFRSGQPRKRLLNNAGFLGAAPLAACPTSPVDLAAVTSAAGTNCDVDPNNADCCERLINECADGPRVLSSQMCDLIRSMGGRRESFGQAPSARPNSANESGVRMARRLINSMLPARPSTTADKFHLRLDCNPAGGGEACDTDSDCGNYDFCDRTALVNNRGQCKPTGNCVQCDPRAGSKTMIGLDFEDDQDGYELPAASCSPGPCACTQDSDCGRGEVCGSSGTCIVDCSPVPMVTIFLSDEEDYFFKDECATSVTLPSATDGWQRSAQQATDESQMPTDCYYRLNNVDGNGLQGPEPCVDPAVQDDPLSYCRTYLTPSVIGLATGYNPDAVPTSNLESMDWRAYNAAECLPTGHGAPGTFTPPEDTCVADPCRLAGTQGTCETGANNSQCVWTASLGVCTHRCTAITVGTPSPTPTERGNQRAACNADPACFFDPGMGVDGNLNGGDDNSVTNQQYACVPRVPLNDCQACKRLLRRYQAVHGEDIGGTGNGTAGLGDAGPVYAIARNRGQEGFRLEQAPIGQDQCGGGPITWGRGDGQAYRDIAIDTLGRTQNVCASSYRDFMQLVVTDIVALSAPYRLAQAPIAATLKVGIGRPNGDGTWTYIEVPRSKTRGFVYDATSNSLGFKSDPIDGVGGTANGVIDPSEVEAARNAQEVPRTDDLVFISYRYWRPVPCPQGCDPDTETCLRTICPDDPGPFEACTGQGTQNCDGGRICLANECRFPCTEDGYFERCVPNPCRECETYNEVTGACTLQTDTCICFSGDGIPCDPTGPNTCPPGMSCDEQCFCEPLPGCSGAFAEDGSVIDCDAAINCCALFSACYDLTTSGACTGNANCTWTGTACEPSAGSCCGANEIAVCYTPIEDPSRKVFACQGAACSCEAPTTCNTDADCNAADHGARKCVGPVGDKHCDCNPITESCLPDAATGCSCAPTPG
ncbi:MAG: hypothetical protein ACAI38_13930 [Myxococcota bacterium]